MKRTLIIGTKKFVHCPEKQDVRLIKVIKVGREHDVCLISGDVHLTKCPLRQESTVYYMNISPCSLSNIAFGSWFWFRWSCCRVKEFTEKPSFCLSLVNVNALRVFFTPKEIEKIDVTRSLKDQSRPSR